MKTFDLSLSGLLLRLYLMMAIVILAGFTGQWILAFLALPVFLSCLLGMRIGKSSSRQEVTHATGHALDAVRQPVHHPA